MEQWREDKFRKAMEKWRRDLSGNGLGKRRSATEEIRFALERSRWVKQWTWREYQCAGRDRNRAVLALRRFAQRRKWRAVGTEKLRYVRQWQRISKNSCGYEWPGIVLEKLWREIIRNGDAPTTALNAPRTAQKCRVDKLYLKTKNE